MRIGKKTQVTYVQESKRLCDLCGEDVEGVLFDASEVTVEANIGTMYPDGADTRDAYVVDICPQCFLDKVKPAIEALGCKFRYRQAYQDDVFERIEE